MIKKQDGFTMVELLVSMVMFVLVIAAASQIFTAQLTQFKQQSKIAETNIEGIIGLELLRRDIKHAGYGLPWVIPTIVAYNEAAGAPANAYNDCSGVAPCNPPRAIFSGDGAGADVAGSDELIIKATNVAISAAAQKWTHLYTDETVREWTPAGERLEDDDRVIVISTGTDRELQLNVASFTTRYEDGTDPDSLLDPVFAPFFGTGTRLVYGVTPSDPNPLRMPFNRADYYVSTANVPARCAPNTGVFRKAVVNHSAGTFAGGILPLLDCVADFQVVYRLDTTGDGTIDTPFNDISARSAEDVRDKVKEVRVYILAHEGQKDPNFTFTNFTCAGDCIRVGFPRLPAALSGGRDLDISGITDYLNYRWKVYTIVVTPENLG